MGNSAAIKYEIEEVIQTKDGEVAGAFRSAAAGSILISHVDNDACPRGAVCMTNRDLARRSPKRVTHAVFGGGLYDVHRALTHIVRRSGLGRGSLASGDIRLIEQMIRDAQARSKSLFQLEFLTDEEHRMMEGEFRSLIRLLKDGRNIHKVEALFQFRNARKFRDSTGRRNLGAAGIRTGAGIGHLMDRKRELVQVVSRVDARIPYVVSLIETAMQPFYKLRELSTPLFVTDKRRRVKPSQRFEALLVEGRRRGMEFLEEKLRECAEDFAQVDVAPFFDQAQRLKKELLAAARACSEGERGETKQLLKVIRQLLAPVFAKHTLEISLIAPLSYLLEEVDYRRAARRKHLRWAPTEEEDREFSGPRFERIEATLNRFYGDLKKCSDDQLPVRYLEEVRHEVGHALAEAKAGRWDRCKNLLKNASKRL